MSARFVLALTSVLASVCTLSACAQAHPTHLAAHPVLSPPVPAQPPLQAFTPGSCSAAARVVLALGRDATRLGSGPELPAGLDATLAASQDALAPVLASAPVPEHDSLQHLVTAVGLVRLRAHTRSYVPSLGRDVTIAYEGVVQVCTKTVPAQPSQPPGPKPAASPAG